MLAAEFARRSIPAGLRPSFDEMISTFRREVKLAPFPKREGEDEAAAAEYVG
jgi:hypothetical protein